jgi:RNA polymerase sigma-70 factor (ECF subfamily)
MRPKFDLRDLHAQLDSRFRTPLMRYFLRNTGDRIAAEDLTQDVFERLLRANERSEITDVEALVFVTASNLLKDRGRKSQRRAEARLLDLDVPAVSEITHEFLEDRSPERVLLARESVADVLRVLDELGPRVRDVFILFRLEGMRHAEIASLYGISRSTVEKDIMRATARLTLRFGRKP